MRCQRSKKRTKKTAGQLSFSFPRHPDPRTPKNLTVFRGPRCGAKRSRRISDFISYYCCRRPIRLRGKAATLRVTPGENPCAVVDGRLQSFFTNRINKFYSFGNTIRFFCHIFYIWNHITLNIACFHIKFD